MRTLPALAIALMLGCETHVDDDGGGADATSLRDSGGCTDGDGDGVCAPDDCDDADPLRAPGRAEICEVGDNDEDCDATTFGERDGDGDGHFDGQCCNESVCGDDCDDSRPGVYADALETCNDTDDDCDGVVDEGAAETRPEVCNGMDDDCDALIDEGATRTFYVDADSDSFGNALESMVACGQPPGYTESDDDCDDASSSTNPGATELCNGVDDDCDAQTDEGCSCTDGASRSCTAPGACAAGTELCLGGTWGPCSIGSIPEICVNSIDDDCDGVVDDGCT